MFAYTNGKSTFIVQLKFRPKVISLPSGGGYGLSLTPKASEKESIKTAENFCPSFHVFVGFLLETWP